MCSNASITEILGINDSNLVILGNEKEKIKGIEYIVLRRKLSYRPDCCPKCDIEPKLIIMDAAFLLLKLLTLVTYLL
ncbi:hypothetical protein [Peptostreptococcus stomatis]|uniref:hypothetical protein n=1 Tax=Peptostreptococcus stomatis TaxID=341694 RepID=UPI002354F69A|nr:hypothetical protein [Peptostreptococcus stomatis]